MQIKKELVQREIVFVICENCNKKIKATSELQLKPCLKIHKSFCKKASEKKEVGSKNG